MTGKLEKKLARFRMAEAGVKYTKALREVLAMEPAAFEALKDRYFQSVRAARYPSTGKDGLDSRHRLSAFETSRRRH